LDYLWQAVKAGVDYQVVAVQLEGGRCFGQVATSGGYIVEVRGYGDIPFTPEEVDSSVVNLKG
jgi:hypothetical protein